jgi:maleamate amidohydrolase
MSLYIPDLLPEKDLTYFEDGDFGDRIGWGESVGLVIVDMTREFTGSESSLGREDTATNAIRAIERILTTYRDLDRPVFYTTPEQTFPDTYPGTTKATPDRESRRGGDNEIPERIQPAEDDILFRKPRASAFFDTHFANMLREYGVDTLLVTGMTTSGCVRATVVDSHSSNFNTIVPKECVADRGIASHEVSLFDMSMKYADIERVADVVGELQRRQ